MSLSLEETWVQWKKCLSDYKDRNSIFNQITTMVWDTAIYRVILKGRERRWEENPEKPQINAEFHNFIDRNYFQSQCATVRRLVDNTRKSKIYGDYGVYSIGALVKDIENHHFELTRSAFLDLHSMPYDYSEIQKRERDYIYARGFGEKPSIDPSEFDWQKIEDAHRQFDRLSGVKSAKRSPDDRINQRVFDGLRAQLSKCDPIVKHVDKFIAHSSTPESRLSQNYDETTMTVDNLWKAHRVIFNVALFLSETIFGIDRMALAIENPSLFMFWDKPLFENGEFDSIRDSFDKYRKETETWRTEGIDDIWSAIEGK